MAESFDVTLPAVGAKPWNLNPAITELRTRIGLSDDKLGTVDTRSQTTADTVNTGRLSPTNLAATTKGQILKDGVSMTPLTQFYTSESALPVIDGLVDFTDVINTAADTGQMIYAPPRAGGYPVTTLNRLNKTTRLHFESPIVQRENYSAIQITASLIGKTNPTYPPPNSGAPLPTPWPVKSNGVTDLRWSNMARSLDFLPVQSQVKAIELGIADDLKDFRTGDRLLIQSSEKYRGSYVTSSSNQSYKGGWANIVGVAVRLSGASTDPTTSATQIPIRSVLSGGTSGPKGIVTAVTVDPSGSVWAVFDSVPSGFTPGETILIDGVTLSGVTAVNSGRLISSELMEDTTYNAVENDGTTPSTIVAWKGRSDVIVDLDISVTTATDPEGPVGEDPRFVSVILEGILDMRAKIHFYRTYKTGVRTMSTYGGELHASGGNLPNITSIQAFGYLVETRGCTERLSVTLNGQRCRHGFTTNGYATNTTPSTDPAVVLRTLGTTKHVTVTGKMFNTTAAAFDTHAGSWQVHFVDCVAEFTNPAGKDDALPVGFQNRSFATIYTNCHAVGTEIGFLDSTYRFPAERNNTIVHINSTATNYLRMGFCQGSWNQRGSTAGGTTSYLLRNPSMIAEPYTGSAFQQVAYSLTMVATTIVNGYQRGAAHADIQLRPGYTSSSMTTVIPVRDLSLIGTFISDHQTSPATTAGKGYIVDALTGIESPRNLNVDGITLMNNDTGNSRISIFHAADTVTLSVRRKAASTGSINDFKRSGSGVALNDAAGTGAVNFVFSSPL